jgi:hypothetical protein
MKNLSASNYSISMENRVNCFDRQVGLIRQGLRSFRGRRVIILAVFLRGTGGDHESAVREKSNCAPFLFDFCPAAYTGGLDLFNFSG